MNPEVARLYAELEKKLEDEKLGLLRSKKAETVGKALTDLKQSQLWYQEAHK